MLTAETVRDLFDYDAETGELRWRIAVARRVKPGDLAGSLNRSGYRCVEISGRKYLAHRIAWLWHYGEWPKNTVDHISRNKSDNRIANLRDVGRTIQSLNRGIRKDNTSGFKGIYWCKASGSWVVHFRVMGRDRHFGYFRDLRAAVEARDRVGATIPNWVAA